MRNAILGALALAALTWSVPALAQEGQAPEPPAMQQQQEDGEDLAMMRFQQVDRMAEPLGLTPDQQARLKKELIARTRERIQLQSKMQLQRFDLQVLLDEAKPDAEAARKLQDQLQATEAALARNRLDTILAVKTILTPEQQRQMAAMRPRQGQGPGGPRQGPGRRQPPSQQQPPQRPPQ